MQFLLTPEEYNELSSRRTKTIQLERNKLQKLCTKIANEMPVKWGWGGPDPKPWKCMIEEDDWYCDNCPVIVICPYDGKSFSK